MVLVAILQPMIAISFSSGIGTCSPTVHQRVGPIVSRLGRFGGGDRFGQDVPPLDEHPRRKVALLVEPTPFTHVSGYSNRFKEMLRFLKQSGDESAVITPDNSADRPSDFLGIPITYVPGFRLPFYRQVQLTVDLGLQGLRRLKAFRPDLIHVATPGFFVLPAILYSRILNLPLVVSYHTHLSVYADRYVTIPGLRQLAVALTNVVLPTVLNFADLTLATSPQLQEQLRAIGCERVGVWRKGIDTNVFSPSYNASNAEMRSRLTDGEPNRPLLLYVGRLGTEKNVGMIKDVLQAIPYARLAVVGAGPADRELRQHFKGEDVVFTGQLSGEPLSRAYAAADVFVMPSESETLGFVVLEAMASGVPPVCANAGGLPSLISDGESGLLFKPGDTADLVAKVNMLLSDARLRRRMGDAGRTETLKWNWQAATSVLRNVQYTQAERRFKERQRWSKRRNRLVSWFRMFRWPTARSRAPTMNGQRNMSLSL
eukprot:CAMPEP_0119344420 /NCGR_PEP_ID=MMETSP1333-20130426/106963_1 /TAXON_ID=418940 /ORGANISM="Scyphosphaera apsteinii, Strain RCC1455" /LENGTH=484 /DNA_ID=CAMNT_0007356859 /DNA_START=26 /DNA_END=1480 /DNA_ORIENTATION=+